MPAAGSLRHQVAFEKRSLADDGFGNPEGAWEQQFVVAADITPRFGGETVMAARLEGKQPLTITVRWSSLTRQITTDWRAHNMRTHEIYDISSVIDPEGRRKNIEMLCQFIGQFEP